MPIIVIAVIAVASSLLIAGPWLYEIRHSKYGILIRMHMARNNPESIEQLYRQGQFRRSPLRSIATAVGSRFYRASDTHRIELLQEAFLNTNTSEIRNTLTHVLRQSYMSEELLEWIVTDYAAQMPHPRLIVRHPNATWRMVIRMLESIDSHHEKVDVATEMLNNKRFREKARETLPQHPMTACRVAVAQHPDTELSELVMLGMDESELVRETATKGLAAASGNMKR